MTRAKECATNGDITPDFEAEPSPISAKVATLIQYTLARRVPAVAVSATADDVTILVPDANDIQTISELEAAARPRKVVPVETSIEEIESLLDHLSGNLSTSDLWLQRRHVAALSRLVDHGINMGQIEDVRPLVNRALEFVPYSADAWLMKARVASTHKEVVEALTVASQIAPNDRRILRWINSMQEFDDYLPPRPPSPFQDPPEQSADLEPRDGESKGDRQSRVERNYKADVNATNTESHAFPEPINLQAMRGPRSASIAPVSGESGLDHPATTTALETPPTPEKVTVADLAFQSARALSASRDFQDLMRQSADALRVITRADSVSVYFHRNGSWHGCSTSPELEERMSEALPKESRLASQAVRQGLPIVITDTTSRLEDVGQLIQYTAIRSFALLPIRVNGNVSGLAYINFNLPERANEVFDAEVGRGVELVLNCAGNVVAGLEESRAHGSASSLDALTDAYTIEQFERLLVGEVERARRYRFSVAVLTLDVDDFSAINERYGRAFGDEALRAVARVVRGLERASDLLARKADDEFVVMLPQTTAKGAGLVAGRLHEALANGVSVQGERLMIRVSIGIASFPERAEDASSLLNAAEIALYTAKEQRNPKWAEKHLA